MATDDARSWGRASAVTVAATMFMEQLDGTVLFTAVPAIAREFGVEATSLAIVTTAYLVASATFIPLGGWLASRFGGRRVFLAAIVLFTLASLGCALSPNLAALTAFRLAQGFAGAMMVPVGRLLVLHGAKPSDLIRAVAYITWPALLAPVLAPLISGILTTTVGWRWIFIINIPIGVVAFLVARRVLTETAQKRRPFDRVGLLLCTVTVFALIVGTELLAGGEALIAACASLVVFAVAVAPAIRHLLRADDPLFDLRVYRVTSFRIANSGGVAYRMTVATTPFLVPLLLQSALGNDAVTAGVLVSAIFLGNVGIKPLTTPILRRFSFKTVLLVSTCAAVVFLVYFATIDASTPTALLFVALLLSGVFRSIGFTAYNTIQFAEMPSEWMPSANTLSSTVQELSVALGVAIASSTLQIALAVAPDDSLTPFHAAFLVMAAISVIAVLSAARLPQGTGDNVRVRG